MLAAPIIHHDALSTLFSVGGGEGRGENACYWPIIRRPPAGWLYSIVNNKRQCLPHGKYAEVHCHGAANIKHLRKNNGTANILQHQHYPTGRWLIIGLEWAETEREFFQDGSKIKREKDIYHHGPKPIPIICPLPEPPSFSLPITFNPILHMWFRYSYFTCNSSSNIKVSPLPFNIGMVI